MKISLGLTHFVNVRLSLPEAQALYLFLDSLPVVNNVPRELTQLENGLREMLGQAMEERSVTARG